MEEKDKTAREVWGVQDGVHALEKAKDAFYVIRSIDAIKGMLSCTVAACDGGLYALEKIGKEG